jgi:hypothetical protein
MSVFPFLLTAISFTYHPGFLLVCVLVAGVGTAILYFKNPRWKEASKTALWSLATLRFFALLILVFFLLKPIFKTRETIFEKPVLALLFDNSQSVLAGMGDENPKATMDQIERDFHNYLSSDYDVIPLIFDYDLRPGELDFSGDQTDFGQAFKQLFQQFRGSNVGAVVMFTDGIPTRGVSPLNSAEARRFRFYGVGLGDTTARLDARISEVLANKVAFSGNQFPVEIAAVFEGLKSAAGELQILRGKEIIIREPFSVDSEKWTFQKRFLITAGPPGLEQYRVKITRFEDEQNVRNNEVNFYVEVKDRRKKIGIISEAPHPDVAAFRRSLEGFDEYEVSVLAYKDLPFSLQDYHLLILHQIPGRRGGAGVPNALASFKNSVLYVIGPDMDLPRFTRFQQRIFFEGGIATETLFPQFNPSFTLFSQLPENKSFFNQLPPLEGIMTPMRMAGTGEQLLNYRIGRVETTRPMVFLGMDNQQRKFGLINGIGTWRWRMEAFKANQRFDVFDNWLSSMVQYLTTDDVKERLEIRHPERIAQFAPIRFEGLLLNPAFEPVNDPELIIEVTGEEISTRSYTFGKQSDRYVLTINDLPPGTYAYQVKTSLGSEKFNKKGGFVVTASDAEFATLQANHDWLRQLGLETGGGLFPLGELSDLKGELKEHNPAPQKVKSHVKSKPFINNWVWMFVVALLLGLEWFIRKRSGLY